MTLIFKENGTLIPYKAQNIFTEAQEVIFLTDGIQLRKNINTLIGVKWNE